MAEIRHYINDQDFGEPRNWQDLEITIDWLTKKDSGTINVSDLEFVAEANEYLQKRILNGLSGGVGIFEGEPYKIKVGDQLNPTFIFDGYLDFTENVTVFGGEEITCGLKKREGEDWLNDVADGFSFAFLYDENIISNGDFVKVPYVINYVPDSMQLIVLSMSIYMITKETIENVQKLAETIADVTDAATPVIGVGVGFGAVAVTAWDLGNFILVAIKAVARIAYIIAMTIAIIKMIEELFEQLLPKKRDHLGMTFKRLFEKGCQYLGLTFSSPIAELSWVHIPQKTAKGGTSGERGFPSNTEEIYTFGGFIRAMKEMFNADFRISNGVFYFDRRDKFIIPSGYQIPDFFNNQERLLDNVRFNTDEIISNYNINWAYDVQDQNTLDDYTGRVFQAITTPIAVNDPKLVSIKNLSEISIPFSLGREKRDLTDVEKVLKSLGKVVDKITGIFGGGTNFENKIENRIGSLLLSSHFLTYGKVIKMNGSKLANDQRIELDAKKLWDNFHFINSFALYNGQHNQYFRYAEQPVSMTIEEFASLMENNFCTDSKGNEYTIEKVVYSPFDTKAVIDYRVKRQYTTNLQVKIV